ncbi:MAG: hypothetical protein ACFFAS_06390 [Promethearchaeota archaeon]
MEVSLKINDEEIPLNEFAKDIIANVNKGVIDTLKKIPEKVQSIKINIDL